MAASAWTKEENEKLKKAVQWFPAYLPNRFEFIARCLGKSVVDVMEHYQDMVDDLLETRSSPIAFADWMIYGIEPSWCRIPRQIWDKQEHEWFLIGLRRFGRDYDNIAALLVTKTPMQVAIYACNFFTWHNSKNNNVTMQRRTIEITMGAGQQERLVPLQPQPPQGLVALESGQHGGISDSESNNRP
ncbi:unnamed protein product [Eruca vesicaria subsp. sativa]|uniref:Myb-like domain-containing protein n=1 Tax=Eruca vesicaria subsp. sativa TaxID=29727 RepID=A0ABC8M102_ERUVS|nr:unnamed protein product [Eruca vesicaria subsp. sativa]